MTTLAFTIGDDDIRRISDAVVARLVERPERRWLTVDGASDYTGLTKDAIRTAAKRGKVKYHKGESGRLVFRVEDLDAYLAGPD